MARMNVIDWLAIVLLIAGGLNWGLVGAFGFDLVDFITFGVAILSRIIKVAVGLAALYVIVPIIKLAFK